MTKDANNVCKKIQDLPKCKEGETLKNGKCEKANVIKDTCPAGQKLVQLNCIKAPCGTVCVPDLQVSCDKGETLKDGKCVQATVITQSSIITCNDGTKKEVTSLANARMANPCLNNGGILGDSPIPSPTNTPTPSTTPTTTTQDLFSGQTGMYVKIGLALLGGIMLYKLIKD